MYQTEKQKMMAISQYAGTRTDYVQGGGGNTSYKFDDRLMAIKASGYALSEVETEKGYVTMDYAGIKTDYAKLAESKPDDIEKETLEINMKNISLLPGMENRRPSVEVGLPFVFKTRGGAHPLGVCECAVLRRRRRSPGRSDFQGQ